MAMMPGAVSYGARFRIASPTTSIVKLYTIYIHTHIYIYMYVKPWYRIQGVHESFLQVMQHRRYLGASMS